MIYDDKMIASLIGFTPGPWQIFKSQYRDFVICERGYSVHSDDRSDGRGNLALIAAAPDLHRIATEQTAEIARLRAALQLTKRLIYEALPKFDWGKSALDANAISLLNEVPAAVNAALKVKP